MSARTKRLRHALVLKRYGFHRALTILDEADRAGISHALAVSMVEQETGNGANVFGHDPSIYCGAGRVTEKKYKAYKRARGTTRMQGVGPLQLTWWSTQDAADRLGGCWKPRYNMRQGFRTLKANMKAHGFHAGVKAYNGSGPAADAYMHSVLARYEKWKRRLK